MPRRGRPRQQTMRKLPVPRHSVLERRVFHQENYHYSYNPRTFILVTPVDTGKKKRIRSESDLIERGLRTHTGTTHETVHWIQQHCTTVGFLTSLLRNAFADLVVKSIASLPQSDRDDLIRMRTKSDALPLIGICSRTGESVVNVNRELGEFKTLAHVVIGFAHVIALFEKPLTAQANWGMRTSAIPTAVNLAYKRVGGRHEMQPAISMEGSGPCFFEQQEITTYGLFEYHACVNELFSMYSVLAIAGDRKVNGREPAARVLDRLNEIGNGEYGCPLRLFFDRVGTNPDNLISSLLTLGLTCYAALNPTFGGRGVAQSPPRQPSWKTIYPPMRFAEMCSAVKKLGLLHGERVSDHPSHEEVVKYLVDLSDCSGLPIAGPPGDRDFSRTMVQSEPSTLGYLLKMRQWFWNESSSKLPLVVEFGRLGSGPHLERYFPDLARRKEKLNADVIVTHHGMFGNYEPPLQWTPDNELLVVGDDVDGARQLMDAAAQECCIEELVFDTGPLRFDGYPSSGAEAAGLRYRTVEALRDRLGSELVR